MEGNNAAITHANTGKGAREDPSAGVVKEPSEGTLKNTHDPGLGPQLTVKFP